jgi:hypothetical protein
VTDEGRSDGKFDQHDEQGEVEAHKVAANAEQADEAEGDDEVEAHRRIATPKLD